MQQEQKLVAVVITLKEAYLAWQATLPHVAKTKRQTIASRVDVALLNTLEYAFRAGYVSGFKKLELVGSAVAQLDVTKFFLLVTWESNAITNSQYMQISKLLVDASKMLVGWKSYLEKKTPAVNGRK